MGRVTSLPAAIIPPARVLETWGTSAVRRAGRLLSGESTIRDVSPAELAAEPHQLRELAPAFGVRTLRQSIERAAKEAMACDDPETRELAEQLLNEVRKIRFA